MIDRTPTPRERKLAAWCHGSLLLTGFVGPLVIWLTAKESSPLVDKNGREALNLCITEVLYLTVATLLSFHLTGVILFYAVLAVVSALAVIATFRILGGNSYRYPFILRLIPKQ